MQSEPQAAPPGAPSSPETAPATGAETFPSHAEAPAADAPGATSTTAEAAPVARIHNAARIEDSVYWAGHIASLVVLVVAIVILVAARGPRRREAIEAARQSDETGLSGARPG